MVRNLSLFILTVLFCSNIYSQDKGLKIGQVPPELVYYSISENKTVTYKKTDFKNKVLLVDFWATWCAPCKESILHINDLTEKFKNENVKFISVTYEPEKLVRKFLIDHPMKSEVGLDEDFLLFKSYNAWAIPNIVMINSEGKIAGRIHPSYLTEEVIKVLLNGGNPDLKNTPEDAFDPKKAEAYFRSFLEKQNK